MTKFKIIALIGLIVASVAAALMIHSRAEIASGEKAALRKQQSRQIADLIAKQQHLSNLVARATNIPIADHSAELAKLRAEAEALRKQTNQLSKHPSLHPVQSARTASPPENHTPEYWEQFRKTAGTKSFEALDLARAMTEYATEHKQQFPATLDQVASYLVKNHAKLSGTNHFEIVYQGSLDELEGMPLTSIALVRESQTWPSPDGKPSRAYGMGGGMGQIISSDDNFQSWEAEHVIPGPASTK